LVSSKLKWAGHVERMGDEKLAKKSHSQKVEGNRRQCRMTAEGRLPGTLRSLERLGGNWKTTAKYRSCMETSC